tara:strand:- start:1175 stop:1399 length:225 start_codon:yes stop_codon:yes gene_type:complete
MKPTYIYTGSDKVVSYVEKEYKSQWVMKTIKDLKGRIKKGCPVTKEQLAWLEKWEPLTKAEINMIEKWELLKVK